MNVEDKEEVRLGEIDFVEWEDKFHKLILLYEGVLNRFQKHHSQYIAKQEGKEFGLDIRMTEKNGSTVNNWIKYETVNQAGWVWSIK